MLMFWSRSRWSRIEPEITVNTVICNFGSGSTVFKQFFVIFFVSPFYVLSVPSVKYSFLCNDYITVLVFIMRISLNSFLKLLVYVYNIQYVICITKY